MVNTAELRNRIQVEIDNHLAIATSLKEKLALIGQVEDMANELGLIGADHLHKAASPNAKPDESNSVPIPVQSTPEEVPATKEGVANGAKNPYAFMQLGLQAYLAGKIDKALELFRQARELNPPGFEKTWTTMTAIPVYNCVGRDKYLNEALFSK